MAEKVKTAKKAAPVAHAKKKNTRKKRAPRAKQRSLTLLVPIQPPDGWTENAVFCWDEVSGCVRPKPPRVYPPPPHV